MGKKLKKMVMKRKGLCDFVVGATKVQGPEIGRSLREYLAPVLGVEETLPDLELPLVLLGRKLSSYGEALVEADQEYFEALAKLAETQASAESLSGLLKGKVLSLRSTCQGLLGDDSVEALALDFNVARDRDALGMLRLGEMILDRIRNSHIELVPRHWVSSPLDREALAQELEIEVGGLRQAVQRFVAFQKQADTAKVRKDQAMEEFDRQYGRIARVLEAFFFIVDEVELAGRIRPTARRLRQGVEEEDGTASGDASETASGDASETSDAEAVVVSEATVSKTPAGVTLDGATA